MANFPFDWEIGNRLKAHSAASTRVYGAFTRGHIGIWQCGPKLYDVDGCHAAITLTTTGQTITTGITAPDVPRNVTIQGGQTGQNKVVTIGGLGPEGAAQTEDITLVDATLVAGIKVFSSVTSITCLSRNSASDTVTVGYGTKLGVPVLSGDVIETLQKFFDGSTDTGTLALSTADMALSTYIPNGTPDGTKKVQLTFILADID